MAISNETVVLVFDNVAAGASLSCNMKVYDASYVHVYYGTEQHEAVAGADFVVTLDPPDYDTFLVLVKQSLLDKIAAGPYTNVLHVVRVPDFVSDFTADDSFYRDKLSDEFDRHLMRLQYLAQKLAAIDVTGAITVDLTPVYAAIANALNVGNQAGTLAAANAAQIPALSTKADQATDKSNAAALAAADAKTTANGAVASVANKLDRSGGTMTGAINHGGLALLNVGNPADDACAPPASWIKTRSLTKQLSTDTFYDAQSSQIRNLADPTDAQHAATPAWARRRLAPIVPLRNESDTPHWREAMTAYRDLDYHFWDASRSNGDTNFPGAIRPIDNYGLINNSLSQTNFWTMSQYVNVMYWHWRLTRSEVTRQKLVAQAKWIKLVYTQAKRQSANVSNNDGAVTWSDDAMWNCNAYMQIYEATGDRTWLTDAAALLQSTMSVFADPNNAGSPYGLYYASASQVTAGQDGGHGRVSSSYEAGLGAASLRIFTENGNSGFLSYGSSVRDNMTANFFHPTGYLYCEFDLDPSHADNGNDQGYKKAKGRAYGPPVRSNAASFSGGTLMLAVLCARLYRYNGNTTYLTQVQNIATNFVKTNAFLRTNLVASGLFLNERDPWDDGYWYPYFVDECLTLPNVDPNDTFKTALLNTCDYIATACRTSDGYYGADWSGDEYTNYPLQTGLGPKWETQAGTGTQPGMARHDQIMTSSSSVAVMLAAAMLTQGVRRDTF